MAHGLHLSQRMALQQVLAPQLQQSLALLQAPMLELKAMVETELQQNPVIEEVSVTEVAAAEKRENEGSSPIDQSDPTEPPADVTFDPTTEKISTAPVDDFQAEFDRLSQMDQEWRDHFADSNVPQRAKDEDEERRQYMFDSPGGRHIPARELARTGAPFRHDGGPARDRRNDRGQHR